MVFGIVQCVRLTTDLRLVVATLKLHVTSRKPPRCNHTVFHLEKLKDLAYGQKYVVTVSNWFEVLDTREDRVELWNTFKHGALLVAKECIREHPKSCSSFAPVETLNSIEESRAPRLAGNRYQYKALSHRTRALLRRDKDRHVRGFSEDFGCHLNFNGL